MSTLKYRADIDGLRALAVLSVILYHLEIDLFSGGFVGVDVFFVISGYLITKLIKDELERTGTFSFTNFYLRRVRRLFPALFFTLLVTSSVAIVVLTPQHLQRFGGALIHSIMSISNIFFWMESGYFEISSSFKPLLHTWSLSVEEQFYMIWPVLLVILLKKNARILNVSTILIIGILSLVSNIILLDGSFFKLFNYQVSSDFDPASTIFFLTPFRVFEFSIGAIFVWTSGIQPKRKIVSEFIFLSGLLLILLPVFYFTGDTVFPSYNALFPCLGAGLLIQSGAKSVLGAIFRNKVSVGVGLISYSFYLVHWPLIVFYKYLKANELEIYDQMIIFIIALLVAILMYKSIEVPFRHKLVFKGALSGARFTTASAVLSLILMLPAAYIWADIYRQEDPQLSVRYNSEGNSGAGLTKKINNPVGNKLRNCIEEESGCIASADKVEKLKMLILGDSNAVAYGKALELFGEKYGVAITSKAGAGFCSPIINSVRVFGGQKRKLKYDKKCKAQILKWKEEIETGNYDYVFLGSRWSFMFSHGKQNSEKWYPKDFLAKLGSNDNISVKSSRENFKPLILETANYILRYVDKIILAASYPMAHGKSNICELDTDDNPVNCPKLPFELAYSHVAFDNEVIGEVSYEHPNRIFGIQPINILCDKIKSACISRVGREFLYKDAGHINDNGAIYIFKNIESQLSKFLHLN